jgi:hypothetical protein
MLSRAVSNREATTRRLPSGSTRHHVISSLMNSVLPGLFTLTSSFILSHIVFISYFKPVIYWLTNMEHVFSRQPLSSCGNTALQVTDHLSITAWPIDTSSTSTYLGLM